jgi:hypothetical protein
MKKILNQYSFYPNSGIIHFSGMSGLNLENFLLVTDVTTNQIIYNFASPAAGGYVSGFGGGFNNALYLDYATSGLNSGDKLQIFYDTPIEKTDYASGYYLYAITGSGTSTGVYSPVVPIDFLNVGGRAVDMQSGFYPDYKRNDAVILNFDKDLGGALALQADLDKDIDSVSTFDAGYSSISNYSSGIVTGTSVSGSGPTVVSGNYNRISLFGQNLGNIPLYVKYGAGASPLSFNFLLYPGTGIGDGNGEKLTDDRYKGDISVNVQPSGATGYYIFWEGV